MLQKWTQKWIPKTPYFCHVSGSFHECGPFGVHRPAKATPRQSFSPFWSTFHELVNGQAMGKFDPIWYFFPYHIVMGFVLHCTVNTSKNIVLSCWYCIVLFHIALYCVTLVDQDTPRHTVITSPLVNYMLWFPLSNAYINLSHIPSHIKHYSATSKNI